MAKEMPAGDAGGGAAQTLYEVHACVFSHGQINCSVVIGWWWMNE